MEKIYQRFTILGITSSCARPNIPVLHVNPSKKSIYQSRIKDTQWPRFNSHVRAYLGITAISPLHASAPALMQLTESARRPNTCYARARVARLQRAVTRARARLELASRVASRFLGVANRRNVAGSYWQIARPSLVLCARACDCNVSRQRRGISSAEAWISMRMIECECEGFLSGSMSGFEGVFNGNNEKK